MKVFFLLPPRGFDLPTLGAVSGRLCPQDHGAPPEVGESLMVRRGVGEFLLARSGKIAERQLLIELEKNGASMKIFLTCSSVQFKYFFFILRLWNVHNTIGDKFTIKLIIPPKSQHLSLFPEICTIFTAPADNFEVQ